MKDNKIYNLLNTLLLTRLMELIKKPEEEEEEKPTPREQLVEMYTNPKDDVVSEKAPDIEKIMGEYKNKPIDQDIIMQKMEAIIKEKEMLAKNQEVENTEMARQEDQQKTFKRAMLGVNKDGR